MDEIAYTPGRLAKKLGIGKKKLMAHLRATGLIEQCFTTRHGYWQIPYSVAARISSPQALSVRGEPRRSRKVAARSGEGVGYASHAMETDKELSFPARQQTFPPQAVVPNYDYAQIGKQLRQAGFTLPDLIKYIQQQMGGTHEQTQNNSAKRNKNQADESKANGSEFTDARSGLTASSDISNSSAK